MKPAEASPERVVLARAVGNGRFSDTPPCCATPNRIQPLPLPFHVGRRGFVLQRRERFLKAQACLRLRTEAADGNGFLFRLLAANDDHHRNLRQRVLAHLVVDFLVAQVAFGFQSQLAQARQNVQRVIVGVGRDRRNNNL